MVVWPGGNHLKLWNEWIANPEGKAREKLDAALESLLVDEDIKKSKICTDFLELMLRISPSDPGAETVFDLVDPLATYFNKLIARSGAAAKLSSDPKQKEKLMVRECWVLWQTKTANYASKAEFARDMLTKYELLKSQRVIEKWCLEWERVPH